MLSKFASAVGPPWNGAVESPKFACRRPEPPGRDELLAAFTSVEREDKPNLKNIRSRLNSLLQILFHPMHSYFFDGSNRMI